MWLFAWAVFDLFGLELVSLHPQTLQRAEFFNVNFIQG